MNERYMREPRNNKLITTTAYEEVSSKPVEETLFTSQPMLTNDKKLRTPMKRNRDSPNVA